MSRWMLNYHVTERVLACLATASNGSSKFAQSSFRVGYALVLIFLLSTSWLHPNYLLGTPRRAFLPPQWPLQLLWQQHLLQLFPHPRPLPHQAHLPMKPSLLRWRR